MGTILIKNGTVITINEKEEIYNPGTSLSKMISLLQLERVKLLLLFKKLTRSLMRI